MTIKTIKPLDFAKMEPQTVGKLVQGTLKAKLREEVTALHYLPKTATIPGL